MDHRIPIVGLVLSVIAAIAAAATFIYLNEAFKGPSVTGTIIKPYELKATFDDVENLPTKTSVLSRGVSIGKVSKVEFNKGEGPEPISGTVTFTIEDEFRPVFADATARIGERTIIGDTFLDVERGHPEAGELDSGSEVAPLPSVDFDEALDFLDEKGRGHLRSVLDTLSQGGATEGNGERFNNTIGGLARTTEELNAVVTALQGQEEDLAVLTSDASTVLGELGHREQALRTIVGSGRVTLDALASNTTSLEQGIEELPGFLDSGQRALRGAQPLLVEIRPLAQDLRAIAPKLKPALGQLGPASRDAAIVIEGLPKFNQTAHPLLLKIEDSLKLAGPVIDLVQPAVRNLVPLLEYLAPRTNGVTAFFSMVSSAFAHGDARGRWARFSTNVVPGELLGGPAPGVCQPEDDVPGVNLGVCNNAYPEPNDARDPEPYKPGDYKRLLPYDPPPRP